MEENPIYLNQYIAIIKRDNKVYFEIDGMFDIKNNSYEFNTQQEQVLRCMLEGRGFLKSELVELFGDTDVDNFIRHQVFISNKQDIGEMMSRTEAFFQFNHIVSGYERLQKKKVLVLGCGGIGTHVAWNLATMGVGALFLLDYDIVELSNLNRQLLFDTNDIGKSKTSVLKKKLSAIAPTCEIHAIHIRITSESELESICQDCKCDLVIKSADTPEFLPLWIDHVCKRMKIDYISGTLTGTYFVIGPTYLAQEKCVGYSDMFPLFPDYQILSGTRPSLSCQVSHASALISAEACRVLLRVTPLKYVNRVHFEDPILMRKMEAIAKNTGIEPNEDAKANINKNILIIAFIVMMTSVLINLEVLVWIGSLIPLVGSVIIYSVPTKAASAVMLNTSLYFAVGFIVNIIKNNLLNSTRESILGTISTVLLTFILYSFILLAYISISYIITLLKVKFMHSIKNEK